jgi:hypothetical protein
MDRTYLWKIIATFYEDHVRSLLKQTERDQLEKKDKKSAWDRREDYLRLREMGLSFEEIVKDQFQRGLVSQKYLDRVLSRNKTLDNAEKEFKMCPEFVDAITRTVPPGAKSKH